MPVEWKFLALLTSNCDLVRQQDEALAGKGRFGIRRTKKKLDGGRCGKMPFANGLVMIRPLNVALFAVLKVTQVLAFTLLFVWDLGETIIAGHIPFDVRCLQFLSSDCFGSSDFVSFASDSDSDDDDDDDDDDGDGGGGGGGDGDGDAAVDA